MFVFRKKKSFSMLQETSQSTIFARLNIFFFSFFPNSIQMQHLLFYAIDT